MFCDSLFPASKRCIKELSEKGTVANLLTLRENNLKMYKLTMAHPVDEIIGRKLRALRIAHGLTQAELGRQVGVEFQQIQKYESAKNRISGSRLWLLANALNARVDDFFPSGVSLERPHFSEKFAQIDIRMMREFSRLDIQQKKAVISLVSSMISGGIDGEN